MKQRGLDELDALRRMVAQSILTISAADQAPTACEQPLRFNLNSNCLHVVAMIIVDLTHGSPNEVVGSSRLDPLLAAAPCVRERAGHSCLSPDHIDLSNMQLKKENASAKTSDSRHIPWIQCRCSSVLQVKSLNRSRSNVIGGAPMLRMFSLEIECLLAKSG